MTRGTNMARSNTMAAINMRKAECGKGHPFTTTNTYLHGGKRYCRTCKRAARKAARMATISS